MAKKTTKKPATKKPPAKKTVAKKTATAPKPKVAAAPAGPVLRALRSSIYKVGDLAHAKTFYSALLGRQPYFDQPYYVGFDVDGQELGLDPDVSRIPAGPGGTIAYWRVDDLYSSWEHALGNGAEPVEPPHNVGEGTDVALVQDPFGNYIGLIQTA
jgi:predicted enzyme related to lactoylglutathione lyase